MRPRIAIVLALIASVAGCASPPEDAPPTSTPVAGPDAGGGSGNSTDGATPSPDVPSLPFVRTLHLTSDGALTDETPAAGSVPMGGSYASCFAKKNCDFLTFESAPLARDILLPPQNVKVSYWFEATAPIAPGAFGYAAWVGSTVAMPLFHLVEPDGPILPGAPVLIEIVIPVEGDPVVIPAGSALRLFALAGSMHEGSGALKLLTGGEKASKVDFTYQEFTLPPAAAAQAQSAKGKLSAPGFPAGEAVPPEQRVADHPFTLPANFTRLTVQLKLVSSASQNGGDLDIDLLVDGTNVAGGHTPRAEESIFLAGPAASGLTGKDVVVRVSNYFAPEANYEVVVTAS